MSKKIILIIILGILVIGGVIFLIYKNNESKTVEQAPTTKENKTNENNNNFKDAAVIYFSVTGNTKEVAGYIKDATNADIFEIIPQEKYTDEDIDYSNDNSRANREQNSDDARPEISNDIDTTSYDTIFLGYPIWWGTVPKIIYTFLDNNDLSGKTVIPFCTSGGSGIKQSMNDLKEYNSNINWRNGEKLNTNKDEVEDWINNLEY